MTSRSKNPADKTAPAATEADSVARALPAWDLLPGHSMLTRRRPNFVRTQPSAASNLPQIVEPSISGTEG
jgi:hypothetical protein